MGMNNNSINKNAGYSRVEAILQGSEDAISKEKRLKRLNRVEAIRECKKAVSTPKINLTRPKLVKSREQTVGSSPALQGKKKALLQQKKETRTEQAIAEAVEKLDPETRGKINKLFHDPSVKLMERVRLELELKKDEHVESLIADMQYLSENRTMLQQKKQKEIVKQQLLSKNLEEEAKRQAKAKAKRVTKVKEDAKARVVQEKKTKAFERKLQQNIAKEKAADIQKIRQSAEKAKEVVLQKEELEAARRAEQNKLLQVRNAFIQEQLAAVENDVLRNLKGAILEQEHITTQC